jgi:protein required for attachment to host cells
MARFGPLRYAGYELSKAHEFAQAWRSVGMSETRKAPVTILPGEHWFVVANGSRAKAYVKRVAASGYDVVAEWDEPEARMRDAALGEDRPGRAFAGGPGRRDAAALGHTGMVQRSGMDWDRVDDSPKEHAKRNLMQRIAEDVAASLRSGAAKGVVLVAPGRLRGELRERIPNDLRHAVLAEHDADLTQLPTAEVFRHLDALRGKA